jgi:hypothetical protein
MNDDIKKSQSNKVEQLIIERPIKIYIPNNWESQDEARLYREDTWTPIIRNGQAYSLKQLMKEGWKVTSVEKSFCIKENGHFGYETAILEREI